METINWLNPIVLIAIFVYINRLTNEWIDDLVIDVSEIKSDISEMKLDIQIIKEKIESLSDNVASIQDSYTKHLVLGHPSVPLEKLQ